MHRRVALPAAALIAIAAFPAAASQQPSDSGESILVTGERLTPAEIRERANAFVAATGIANGQRPAARWQDRVCPKAIGIHRSYARIVEARIRAIAASAAVPLAPERCRANLVVTFVAGAGQVAQRVARRRPHMLSEVPAADRAALLAGTAPIRWWYRTDIRSADGTESSTAPAPWTSGNAPGGGSVLPDGIPALQQYRSSVISTQAVRVLRSASVLIDLERAEGLSLDAVAAYAAFVGLAEVRLGDTLPRPSILALVDGERERRDLSEWDLAFLRALYRLPLDRIARQHRGALRRGLIEATN